MQHFEFITLRDKIQVFRPHNPFAPGIIEILNVHPVDQQPLIIMKVLQEHNLRGELIILGVNYEYECVLYRLTIYA